MKNIKRYLIYFTICLVSLFVFSNNVFADTIFQLDYENYNNSNRLNIYEEIKTYIDNNNTRNLKYMIGYYINDEFNQGEGIYVLIQNPQSQIKEICNIYVQSYIGKYSGAQDEITGNIMRNICNADSSSSQVSSANYSLTIYITLNDYNNNTNNKTTFYNDLLNFLTNPTSGNTKDTILIGNVLRYHFARNSITYNTYWNHYHEIYYSSWPIYYIGRKMPENVSTNEDINTICNKIDKSNTYDATIYYNDGQASTSLTCGDTFPTYLDYVNNQVVPNIQVSDTSYRYTEEDNNFIYKKIASITFNEDYVNDNYKLSYEYSDGLEYSKNGVLTGVNDTIDIYVNGTLKIYIKDSQNNLIDSYEQTYSDLGELSQRAAFDSNGNGANIYSLNVHYNFGSMTQYGVMPFRIMYYSNDFSETNTPRLIGFKKYYYDSNNSKKLVNNDFELFDIQDLECRKYSNQVICNGFIINNIPFNNFEIDFLFNHIENYSMHYFDQFTQNFSARDVSALSNDLVGYTKYYFPTNSDRAYIFKKHINQNNKTGSVVFPWYYTERDSINVKATYYNSNDSNNNSFNFLPILLFENNEYYKKFDFDLTSNEVLTVLVDRVNSCPRSLGETIAGVKSPKLNIACEFDSAYIFVPDDFIVNFNQYSSNPQDDTYQILTDDDGNKVIVDKGFNYQDFYNQHDINSLFDRITNELNKVKPLTTEFSNTFTRMWNKISPERQSLIITCFCMLVVISIVLMARRG